MSEGCFNQMVQLMGETTPEGNRVVTNLYHARKSIQNFGLGCSKINCCPKGCMLYYNENSNKTITNQSLRGEFRRTFMLRKCGTLHMRLYSLIVTTSHMRWHSENERDPALMSSIR
ncbi:hypothetical protein CR513_31889, partial [Mucuna pruriens]